MEDGRLPDAERPTSWRWIGRLLPASLRDLMYEPMCDDLWRAHVTASVPGGRLGLWTRFLGCFAASVGYSLPRYFVERGGHVTAVGKVAYVLAMSVALVMVVLLAPWIVELARTR